MALAYVPNQYAAYIFGALYALAFIAIFLRTAGNRAWWTLCLPIGAFFEALGFFLRLAVRQNQDSTGLYIVMYMCIVLSPATFLAFNYIIYGRLIVAVDGSLSKRGGLRAKSHYSLIPPRLVGRMFIWSDVVTFLIQASGGGLMASKDGSGATVGENIFLVGIILQGLSYLLFSWLTTHAFARLRKDPAEPSFNQEEGLTHPTRRLFYAVFFSSVFILIRSVYRIVELAMGFDGVLYQTEIYFLIFDSAPLLIAIGVFIFVWPSGLLDETYDRCTQAHDAGTGGKYAYDDYEAVRLAGGQRA